MAIDPILIQFAAGGLQDVGRAFDTVEQRIIKLEQGSTRAVEAGTRTRVRAAETEAKDRTRVAEGLAKTTERVETQKTREQERQVKYLEQVRRRSSEMAGRYAEQQANKELKEAERAARDVEKLEEYKMRVRIRSSEMAGRAAAAAAQVEERAREKIARGIGGATSRGIGGALGGIGSMATGALTIGGGFALADIAKKQFAAQAQAALIVNEVTVGGKVPLGANVANIMGRASQVSRETGMAKADVQAGMLAYTRNAKGGDFANAFANMGFFAKIAKTTGADITEIATGAGTLQSQNPNLKAPQMQQMILDMMAQGHAGQIPLAQMAGLAGIVGSARGSFAGDVATNQRKLLGLTQLGRSEAGGAEEAARGLKQMAIEVDKPKKAALLKSWGVHYDKHGQIESPEQLISAAMRATDGNLIQLGEVFGTRSGGLMRHLSSTYREAGGGAKGQAAISAEMASVTQATTKPEELEAQFQQLMSTPAEKFQKAMNDISEVVGARLTPFLEKMANSLERGAPNIEKFLSAVLDVAEFLVNNPWVGIGVAIGASIEKEIIGAGIKSVLAGTIKQEFSGLFAGGLAIGAATLVVGSLLQGNNSADNAALIAGAQGDVGKLSSGKVTPDDINKVQADVKKLEAEKATLEKQVSQGPAGELSKVPGVGTAINWLANTFGDAGFSAVKDQLVATSKALQATEKAAAAASTGLRNLGATAQNTSPNAPGRNLPISQRPVN